MASCANVLGLITDIDTKKNLFKCVASCASNLLLFVIFYTYTCK